MANFFLCRECGTLAEMIHDGGAPLFCCGKEMEALTPSTAEAGGEKHLPVAVVRDDTVEVNVGSVGHPMTPEHLIQWVYVQTERGGQRKQLKHTDAPRVTFRLADDRAQAVYAYCNLHGLWMTKL